MMTMRARLPKYASNFRETHISLPNHSLLFQIYWVNRRKNTKHVIVGSTYTPERVQGKFEVGTRKESRQNSASLKSKVRRILMGIETGAFHLRWQVHSQEFIVQNYLQRYIRKRTNDESTCHFFHWILNNAVTDTLRAEEVLPSLRLEVVTAAELLFLAPFGILKPYIKKSKPFNFL